MFSERLRRAVDIKGMPSSLQQLCRAWCLASRSTAIGGAHLADALLVSSTGRSIAALPSLAATQPWQQFRSVTSLLPLTRVCLNDLGIHRCVSHRANHHKTLGTHIKISSTLRLVQNFHWTSSQQQAEEAVVNPLQQTPAPASTTDASLSDSKETLTAKAILRNVAISPRKLNDFARILSGLHIDDALIQCRIHPKKSAQICEKVLLSARANAINNHGLTDTKLKVEQAWVGKGQYMKRVRMHGRGRSGVMHKYRSHLTIILKEEETRKKTRILPSMQERKKFWNMREGVPAPDNRWWKWWPQRHLPPEVKAEKAAEKAAVAAAVAAAAAAGNGATGQLATDV